jgi:hypothetical protein
LATSASKLFSVLAVWSFKSTWLNAIRFLLIFCCPEKRASPNTGLLFVSVYAFSYLTSSLNDMGKLLKSLVPKITGGIPEC